MSITPSLVGLSARDGFLATGFRKRFAFQRRQLLFVTGEPDVGKDRAQAMLSWPKSPRPNGRADRSWFVRPSSLAPGRSISPRPCALGAVWRGPEASATSRPAGAPCPGHGSRRCPDSFTTRISKPSCCGSKVRRKRALLASMAEAFDVIAAERPFRVGCWRTIAMVEPLDDGIWSRCLAHVESRHASSSSRRGRSAEVTKGEDLAKVIAGLRGPQASARVAGSRRWSEAVLAEYLAAALRGCRFPDALPRLSTA